MKKLIFLMIHIRTQNISCMFKCFVTIKRIDTDKLCWCSFYSFTGTKTIRVVSGQPTYFWTTVIRLKPLKNRDSWPIHRYLLGNRFVLILFGIVWGVIWNHIACIWWSPHSKSLVWCPRSIWDHEYWMDQLSIHGL